MFDKDGTLIEFHKLWLGATEKVIKLFCTVNQITINEKMQKSLLEIIGVEGEKIRQDGALAYKTYAGIGKDIAVFLETRGIIISEKLAGRQLEVLYETVLGQEEAQYIPTCDLKKLFGELKKKGIKIGLATADNEQISRICLEKLEILQEFDYLGWDDGSCCPKPAPDMLDKFCEQCGLLKGQVAVVGDTVNDMRFAKENGAIGVATLSGLGAEQELREAADVVVRNPSELVHRIINNCYFE